MFLFGNAHGMFALAQMNQAKSFHFFISKRILLDKKGLRWPIPKG
jgi:hypothetical protein